MALGERGGKPPAQPTNCSFLVFPILYAFMGFHSKNMSLILRFLRRSHGKLQNILLSLFGWVGSTMNGARISSLYYTRHRGERGRDRFFYRNSRFRLSNLLVPRALYANSLHFLVLEGTVPRTSHSDIPSPHPKNRESTMGTHSWEARLRISQGHMNISSAAHSFGVVSAQRTFFPTKK